MKKNSKRNFSLPELADFYYDVRKGIYYNESNILALKKILFWKDKNESINYLGLNPVLDAINYSKRFLKESEKYLEFAPNTFFDKKMPSSLKNYLENLPRRSKMRKRLIAARIQKEHFPYSILNEEDFLPKDVYDLAVIHYIGMEEQFRDEESALHSALCEIIVNYPESTQIKMLGQDEFLDAKLHAKKLHNLELNDYFKEAERLMPFGPNSNEEEKYYSLLDELIEDPENYMSSLIAQKILPSYSLDKLDRLIGEYDDLYYGEGDED